MVGDGVRPRSSLRLVVRKVDSLERLLSVILRQSEPYSMGGRAQRWCSFSLMLYWGDFHTSFCILKAFPVLLRRLLMSLCAPPTHPTVLPRYEVFVVGRLLHLVLEGGFVRSRSSLGCFFNLFSISYFSTTLANCVFTSLNIVRYRSQSACSKTADFS